MTDGIVVSFKDAVLRCSDAQVGPTRARDSRGMNQCRTMGAFFSDDIGPFFVTDAVA